MSTLIAIGAAIAVFTGIGAGIGIGHATGKAVNRDRKSTRLNSSHNNQSRMPSSA